MNTPQVELTGHLSGNLCLQYPHCESAVAKFGVAINRYCRECSSCNDDIYILDVEAFGEIAERVCREFALDRKVRVEGFLMHEMLDSGPRGYGSCVSVLAERVQFDPVDDRDCREICTPCAEQKSHEDVFEDIDNSENSPFH